MKIVELGLQDSSYRVMNSLAALALAFAVAACGGSSDSSGDPGGNVPEPPPGEATSSEQAACDGMGREMMHMDASTMADGAHGEMMEPGENTYMVHLPDGAASWAVVDIPRGHSDWIVAVDHADVAVAFVDEDGMRVSIPQNAANRACPEQLAVHAEVHIHEMGHMRLEFAADGPRVVHVQIFEAGSDGHHDGGGDMLSDLACSAFEGEPIHFMAPTTADGAMGVEPLEAGELYHIMLPQEGAGYAMLHAEIAHSDWAIFSEEHGAIVRISMGEMSSDVTPHAPSAVCEELIAVDTRLHLHEAGMYLIEFADEGARDSLLLMAPVDGEHGDHGDHGDMGDENHDGHGDMGDENHDGHGDMGDENHDGHGDMGDENHG